MIVWGISALSHDAAITVMEGDRILFAGHSERYSRIKNDDRLNWGLIEEAISHGKPERIYWYERPFLKKMRQIYAGQFDEALNRTIGVRHYMDIYGLKGVPITYVDHHRSHAAAGFYTSPFEEATVIVVDGIGEWDTATIWQGKRNTLKKVKSFRYPNSLGLFYSAITQRVGLKPNEDEYILMGMAAYGNPTRAMQLKILLEDEFIDKDSLISLKSNMHRGISYWQRDLHPDDYSSLALAAQMIVEEQLVKLFRLASAKTNNTNNVVFMGGVALNCVANSKLARSCIFENFWIMPNPGDAGSSLGAILAGTNQRANWTGPYLGHDIDRKFDFDGAVEELVNGSGIIAVANGKAEFGPRALGNRSLIADPRGQQMKDKVNDIKHRQRFRPFAPVVSIRDFHEEFYCSYGIKSSPYMQYVARAKNSELYPAICHADNSARVQTVDGTEDSVIFELLKRFKEKTGCPLLLNTSLNIKGEPLVNTWNDALRFGERYNVKVF